ncbi:SIS domain-containing protein [Pandoraea sp. NPDC087047]|uniref:KpsF/GutQ family sugar-phosphate isomerase n=1 Tax=Pandoraea sp. NPDC087047 TaxID=3364390 RepID=UPI0038017715
MDTASLQATVAIGAQVFAQQASALAAQGKMLSDAFGDAVELLLNTRGKVVVSGMGKSGIIGRKIAATLASTGTSSFFVHPAEAFHGDLGMIGADDSVLLISNSGETDEVLKLLPYIRHVGVPTISITGDSTSTLAGQTRVHLAVTVEREACLHNLAPTTSTTAALVMGDALAVALMERRRFKPTDFATFHPGGTLGRRLLSRVSDLMHCAPVSVQMSTPFLSVVEAITRGRTGAVLVLGDERELCGIVTDGDLRRAISHGSDVREITARDMMTAHPVTISANAPFAEAETLMVTRKISTLVALDAGNAAVGIISLFDT